MELLVNAIVKVWEHDINTIVWLFGQWWTYFVVPPLFYMFFLLFKWTLITLPLWLTVSLTLRGLNLFGTFIRIIRKG